MSRLKQAKGFTYYVPPSQKNTPCASCVHSQELLSLSMNQIGTTQEIPLLTSQ
jgi:hypothetical protein